MPRVSPSSRWVVLPTVLATAAIVTAVAWAGATPEDHPAANETRYAAAAGTTGTGSKAGTDAGTTRTPADASREHRTLPAPPAAGRFHPRPSPSRSASPTMSPTGPGAPTASAPMPSAPAPAPVTTAPGQGGVTAQVVTLTNAERAKAGCGPLAVDATLTQVAQAHSQDMATNNYFDHNSQDGRSPFDRITAAGYRFSTAAENIAAGQKTPQDVMTSWMNSPGHRANILNCALHEIGVGYATASSSTYGSYWTQDFGTPQ
jgi:uncharacterized protein YkwD